MAWKNYHIGTNPRGYIPPKGADLMTCAELDGHLSVAWEWHRFLVGIAAGLRTTVELMDEMVRHHMNK